MKLWILEPVKGLDFRKDPWFISWHGKAHGFIVRAETEAQARKLAGGDAGEEGHETWLDDTLTTCVELPADGEPGVIMADYVNY